MIDPKQLADLAKKFEAEKEFISNEEETKAAFVVPLVQLLGYNPQSPREVRREYTAPFVQGDGKKFPDRMDLAIFDPTGQTPRFVIEVKPIGTDLQSKSQQLARYIGQIPDLHFGIMTDGCHFLFYGDLENSNVMDRDPFYCFALDDAGTDWSKVAAELGRFHRDSFNADTLVTDAENAKYRQAMIDKLATALRAPTEDEEFVKWLSGGIYKGKRTTGVMARLTRIAKESVEPALLKAMSDDFVEKLRSRLLALREESTEPTTTPPVSPEPEAARPKKGIVTTEEELAAFEKVKEICVAGGHVSPEDIIWNDTTNYFNISYKRPKNWFLRYFGDSRRKNIATMVPVEEAQALCPGFVVEPCPPVFGVSRVYIESEAQVAGLGALILKALRLPSTMPPTE